MKKYQLFSALIVLALAPISCSPAGGGDAIGDITAIHQSGTWIDEGNFRLFPSGDVLTDSGSSASEACPSGSKLLESTSGACTPDGAYQLGCDVCCNPELDASCARSSTAEEYANGQVEAALAMSTNTYAAAAASAVVASYVSYFLRTSDSSGSSTKDRDRLCSAQLKVQKVHDQTVATVGTLKGFSVKLASGNTSPELAVRNALLTQRQSVRLLLQACQSASISSK